MTAKISYNELQALWNDATLSLNDIAEQFNVSTNTVRNYAKKYGLEQRQTNKQNINNPLFTKDELYNLYIEEGLSTQKIADKYNTTTATVYNYLKRFNIDKKQKQRQHKQFEPDFNEFYDLFKVQKRPVEELMEYYDVSRSAIYKYAQQHNIARTKSEGHEAAKITMKKRHGVAAPLLVPEFKDKYEQTSLEKYGTKNPSQSEKVSQKRRQTFIEKYGVESPFESQEIQEKRKQTMIERYGSEFPLSCPELLEKCKNTKMERYGTLNITENAKQKNKDKYGVEYPLQSEEIRKKTKRSYQEKTGYSNPFENPEIKDKIKDTMKEKYGSEHALQSHHGRDKMNATCQAKYGVDWPTQSEIHQQKMKEKQKDNHNGRLYTQHHIEHYEDWQRFSEYCKEKYAETGKKLNRHDEANYFNVSLSLISLYIKKANLYDIFQRSTESDTESYWKNWIQEQGLYINEDKRNSLIYPYEIDIPILESNIGLEINPTFFHNSTYNPIGDSKEIKYHQKKAQLAEEKGINLIQIFDWYDDDKIKSIILSLCGRNSRRIYARNTEIRELPRKDEKTFFNDNHLQGYIKSEICYGLYYYDKQNQKEELVAAMSFSNPRYGNKEKADWELLRFCSLDDTTVVGGASKLFSHFLKEYDPNTVMSFANYDISNGKIYEKLGFEFIRYSNPSFTWSNLDGTEFYSWYLINSKGYDNVFHTQHGKGTSNDQLMIDAGFVKVYNSGNKVYLWTKEKHND